MFYKFKIGLQFFAAEGTAAGAGAGQMSGASTGAVGVAQPTGIDGAGVGTVIENEGKNASNGVATVPEEEIENGGDPDAEFEDLIGKSGKYNKQFTARVDEILKKRHGQTEGMKSEISALTGKVEEYERGLAPLYQLYGVQNVGELYDKISANSSFWEEEAERRGMTASELQAQIKRDMELAELRRENERLKSAEEGRANEAKQRAQYEMWDAQVAKLRESVPDFDMQSEMENNRDFAKLIRAGIGIDMAYNMTHMDEQISRAKEDGRKEAAEQIAQRKARPKENAAAYSGGASITPKMPTTAAERAEVAKRAARGEMIDFKGAF